MSKAELIRELFAKGKSGDLFDLLSGTSPYNENKPSSGSVQLASIELTKLVAGARRHLSFVAKYGSDKKHVIEENGGHFFSNERRFEEWLDADAPGVSLTEVASLYKGVGNYAPDLAMQEAAGGR